MIFKNRKEYLCLLVLFALSCHNDFIGVKMFEVCTTVSLSSYEFEVESEVITTGTFGSDSYTQYEFAFTETEFDKLLASLNDKTELGNKELWLSQSSIDTNSIEYNSSRSFQLKKNRTNCFNMIVIYKNKKVIIIYEACN